MSIREGGDTARRFGLRADPCSGYINRIRDPVGCGSIIVPAVLSEPNRSVPAVLTEPNRSTVFSGDNPPSPETHVTSPTTSCT
jgi:hypothetical protein